MPPPGPLGAPKTQPVLEGGGSPEGCPHLLEVGGDSAGPWGATDLSKGRALAPGSGPGFMAGARPPTSLAQFSTPELGDCIPRLLGIWSISGFLPAGPAPVFTQGECLPGGLKRPSIGTPGGNTTRGALGSRVVQNTFHILNRHSAIFLPSCACVCRYACVRLLVGVHVCAHVCTCVRAGTRV